MTARHCARLFCQFVVFQSPPRRTVGRIAFALAAALFMATRAAAQVPERLTLAEAVKLAEERNPELRGSRNGVQAAEADKKTARALPNPALTFDSEGRSILRSPVDDGHEYSIRLDQDILLGGRRRLQGESADIGVVSATAQMEDVRRRVLLDVRRAYLQAVLALADHGVATASLSEIDRVIALNKARLDQGTISGVEFRRLQVERLRFADDVFASDLALRNARSALLALLNMPNLNQPFELAEPLVPVGGVVFAGAPTLDALALTQQAAINRPDLAAATAEVARATTETRLQRALRTPSPTLGAGYKHNGGNETFVFGVTIPLPLLNRNAGPILRAEAERARAENFAQSVRLAVNLDVQQAINAVETSRARVEYIEREALKNAQETRDIVLASYRAGAVNLIDFLDAQRAYRDTVRSYNGAVFAYRISVFQMEAAAGVPPVRR
jgi:cobalt-zinc-cadmium efflux system outer membrane protein